MSALSTSILSVKWLFLTIVVKYGYSKLFFYRWNASKAPTRSRRSSRITFRLDTIALWHDNDHYRTWWKRLANIFFLNCSCCFTIWNMVCYTPTSDKVLFLNWKLLCFDQTLTYLVIAFSRVYIPSAVLSGTFLKRHSSEIYTHVWDFLSNFSPHVEFNTWRL